jgi:hypothetical protein
LKTIYKVSVSIFISKLKREVYEYSGPYINIIEPNDPKRKLAEVSCITVKEKFNFKAFKTTAFEALPTPYFKRDIAYIQTETHHYRFSISNIVHTDLLLNEKGKKLTLIKLF